MQQGNTGANHVAAFSRVLLVSPRPVELQSLVPQRLDFTRMLPWLWHHLLQCNVEHIRLCQHVTRTLLKFQHWCEQQLKTTRILEFQTTKERTIVGVASCDRATLGPGLRGAIRFQNVGDLVSYVRVPNRDVPMRAAPQHTLARRVLEVVQKGLGAQPLRQDTNGHLHGHWDLTQRRDAPWDQSRQKQRGADLRPRCATQFPPAGGAAQAQVYSRSRGFGLTTRAKCSGENISCLDGCEAERSGLNSHRPCLLLGLSGTSLDLASSNSYSDRGMRESPFLDVFVLFHPSGNNRFCNVLYRLTANNMSTIIRHWNPKIVVHHSAARPPQQQQQGTHIIHSSRKSSVWFKTATPSSKQHKDPPKDFGAAQRTPETSTPGQLRLRTPRSSCAQRPPPPKIHHTQKHQKNWRQLELSALHVRTPITSKKPIPTSTGKHRALHKVSVCASSTIF